MIITTVKIHGLTHKRREILQTVRGLAERMLKNSGCFKIDIFQDLENSDILYLLEEWQSERDLEEYKTSKSLAVLLGLRALLVESVEIKHAVKCRWESVTKNKQINNNKAVDDSEQNLS